ncbi:putative RiPP precursor [Mesorhizobium sp. PAMC28654]|nr:putative RiPP precursor [Mesorhizobium sp. PAMC28654]UDL89193.1 putative RiPP precursor [Mesorhizobium sp. PAMC28654]
MKKIYEKPVLVRREKLSKVTAALPLSGNNGPA